MEKRRAVWKKPASRGIALIGLPGSGKSTVGRWLEGATGMKLLDTDCWIEESHGKSLTEMDRSILVAEEDRALASLDLRGSVVSTSGSVVYGRSLDALQTSTRIFYLQREIEEVRPYLHGRVILGQSLEERIPLYEEWAEETIPCKGLSLEELGWEIIEKYRKMWYI